MSAGVNLALMIAIPILLLVGLVTTILRVRLMMETPKIDRLPPGHASKFKHKSSRTVSDLKVGETAYVAVNAGGSCQNGKAYLYAFQDAYFDSASKLRLRIERTEKGFIAYLSELKGSLYFAVEGDRLKDRRIPIVEFR